MKLYLDFIDYVNVADACGNDYVNVADACGFGTCVAMDSFVHGMTEAGLTVSLIKNEDLYPGVVRVFGNKDMAKEVFRTLVQSFTAGFETGFRRQGIMNRETKIAQRYFSGEEFTKEVRGLMFEPCAAYALENRLRGYVDGYRAGIYGIESELLQDAVSRIDFYAIAVELLDKAKQASEGF